MHDKQIKIRTEKTNKYRALKPGGVRRLNLLWIMLQCLCYSEFYFKCFFSLLRVTL